MGIESSFKLLGATPRTEMRRVLRTTQGGRRQFQTIAHQRARAGRVVSLADGIGRRAGALRKMLKGYRRAVRDGAIADADCPPDDDITTWHGQHLPRRGRHLLGSPPAWINPFFAMQ